MIFASLIQLPAGFTGDIASNTTALISDFGGYITLIVGVLLACVVISFIIGALKS